MLEPGGKHMALRTPRNRKNGVPWDAECWIAFVDRVAISVYIPTHHSGEIKFKVPRELFGMNFKAVPGAPVNRQYSTHEHFAQLYT
jgi:hypothetical protein